MTSGEARPRLSHAWASTFTANVAIMLCGVATGVVTARVLLPEGRGAIAAIMLWPQLLAEVGLFGIHEALTQRISSGKQAQEQTLSTALVLSAGLSAAAALLGYFLAPALLGHDRAQLVGLARLYTAIVVPVSGLTLALYGFDHGRLQFGRYNLSRVLMPSAYAMALVILWASGAARLGTILAASVGASIVGLCAAVYFVRRSLRFACAWREVPALLTLAWRFNVTAGLLMVSTQAERIIVVRFWDNRAVGLYFVALTVSATAAKALAHSIHTVMFPNMARQPGAAAQRAYLARGLRYTVLLAGSCTLALILCCSWMVPAVFGREFSAAVNITAVLVLAQFPNTLRQVAIRALRGLGEGRPGSIAEALAGGVFLLLAGPLSMAAGLSGIAWAVFAGNVCSLMYVAVYLRKRLGLDPRDWWGLDRRTVVDIASYGRALLKSRSPVNSGKTHANRSPLQRFPRLRSRVG
ncbi:MAG TPA: lipopolysaccharide biosynthesis protein [Bryobacteraceae bacterium]|nr:lipopolysaccharide biosynthesis protein [Bryobacteraceae bacterium]